MQLLPCPFLLVRLVHLACWLAPPAPAAGARSPVAGQPRRALPAQHLHRVAHKHELSSFGAGLTHSATVHISILSELTWDAAFVHATGGMELESCMLSSGRKQLVYIN